MMLITTIREERKGEGACQPKRIEAAGRERRDAHNKRRLGKNIKQLTKHKIEVRALDVQERQPPTRS